MRLTVALRLRLLLRMQDLLCVFKCMGAGGVGIESPCLP